MGYLEARFRFQVLRMGTEIMKSRVSLLGAEQKGVCNKGEAIIYHSSSTRSMVRSKIFETFFDQSVSNGNVCIYNQQPCRNDFQCVWHQRCDAFEF